MKKLFTLFAAAMACTSMMAQCLVYDDPSYEKVDATGTGVVWGSVRELNDAPADTLYFEAHKNSALASSALEIGVSKDGQTWTQLDNLKSSLTTDYQLFFRVLDEDVRYIRFGKNGIGAQHIQNVRVTQKSYLRNASVESLSFDAVTLGSVVEPLTFTVDFSAVGAELAAVSNNELFSVEVLDGPADACDFGTATISVSYLPVAAGNDTALVTIGDVLSVQVVGAAESPIYTALPENKEIVKAVKVLRNGQLLIRREDVLYDLRGQLVK